MLFAVNERSFENACSNDDEAIAALKGMVEILKSDNFKKFSGGNKQLFIQEKLKDVLITETKTIHTCIVDMYNEKGSDLPEYAAFLMQSLVSQSRVIQDDETPQELIFNGETIIGSSLNFSFDCNIHYALISLPNLAFFSDNYIEVAIEGKKYKTINITTLESLNSFVWNGSPNSKKHGKNDVIKDKGIASRMDLKGDEAQYALSNSVKVPGDGGTFYFDGVKQWYKFNFESENVAHGFCVDNPNTQNNFNLANKVFKELGDRRIGQIYIDYTKVS
jgi:hypothetical protein